MVDQHIGLYVNEFTADLGEDGYRAVDTLLGRATAQGLTPPVPALSRDLTAARSPTAPADPLRAAPRGPPRPDPRSARS